MALIRLNLKSKDTVSQQCFSVHLEQKIKMILEFVPFVEYLKYVRFDFDSAQQKLREREVTINQHLIFTGRYRLHDSKTFLRTQDFRTETLRIKRTKCTNPLILI